MAVMAAGPFVPFEAWPQTTRRAIGAAYAAKADRLAERIRADPTWQRCSCAPPAPVAEDGRCRRCYGRPAIAASEWPPS